MKINSKIVLGLGVAFVGVSAFAQAPQWTVTAPTAITVTAGATGTSVWTFDPAQDGSINSASAITAGVGYNPYYGAPGTAGNPFLTYTAISYSETSFTTGNPFTVTVSWSTTGTTPYGTTKSGFINFSLDTTDGSEGGSQNFSVFTPTPTPEPAQTVAGAMLLGCGGLVFAGRRLFKK